MSKHATILAGLLAIILVEVLVYSLCSLSKTVSTPLTEQEKAQIADEFISKIECSGYGNILMCKVPVFENPIFRVVKVKITRKINGYRVDEEYLGVELTSHNVDMANIVKEFSQR